MKLIKIISRKQTSNFLVVIIKDHLKLPTKGSRISAPSVEPFYHCSKQSDKRVDMKTIKIIEGRKRGDFLKVVKKRPP